MIYEWVDTNGTWAVGVFTALAFVVSLVLAHRPWDRRAFDRSDDDEPTLNADEAAADLLGRGDE